MDHQRTRFAPYLPACLAQTTTPIYLFDVHEVAFVEQADLVDGSTAYEHARSQRMVNHKRRSMARIAPVQARIRQPVVEWEQFKKRLADAREMKCRMLEVSVGVN